MLPVYSSPRRLTLALVENAATDAVAESVVSARVLTATDWISYTTTLSVIANVTNAANTGTVSLYDTVAAAEICHLHWTGAGDTALTAKSIAVTMPAGHLCEFRLSLNPGGVPADQFLVKMAELVFTR